MIYKAICGLKILVCEMGLGNKCTFTLSEKDTFSGHIRTFMVGNGIVGAT